MWGLFPLPPPPRLKWMEKCRQRSFHMCTGTSVKILMVRVWVFSRDRKKVKVITKLEAYFALVSQIWGFKLCLLQAIWKGFTANNRKLRWERQKHLILSNVIEKLSMSVSRANLTYQSILNSLTSNYPASLSVWLVSNLVWLLST